MTNSLASTVHRSMIRRLVGQRITDADGQVLDAATVVVIDDADGDPLAVFSPTEWRRIQSSATRLGVDPLINGNTRGKPFHER